jgi:hypothetical protein
MKKQCILCGCEYSLYNKTKKRTYEGLCHSCYPKGPKSGHLMSYTDTYSIWEGMLRRCFNPNYDRYHNYGGRGITVCDRWNPSKNPYTQAFKNFYQDMGPRPSKDYSIDRIDNDGAYCPENCRWADKNTQAKNRPITKIYTHNGLSLSLSEWAELLGVKKERLRYRLNSKWPYEDVFTKERASLWRTRARW